MSKSVRRLVAGGIATLLATVGVQVVGTGSAFAHSNTVTGNSVCQQDGTYTVTWTVSNDYDLAEAANITEHTPTGASVDPTSFNLDNKASGTVSETNVDGTATTATLTVHGVWSDNVMQTVQGTVTLDGTCGTTTPPTPEAPSVTQATCQGGTPTAPTLTLADTAGITYSAAPAGPYTAGQSVTVTATATGNNTFDQAATPSGWTFVDSTHETYALTFDNITCGSTPTPEAPSVTQATCQGGTPTAPTLTLANTAGITYSAAPAGPYTAGQSVTVTATATGNNTFDQAATPSGWTFVDSTHETYALTFDNITCGSTPTPEAPSVTQATCQGGTPTAPTLTLANTAGITYSAAPAGPYTAGQSVTVTATATGNNTFDQAATPSGWTFVDSTHETYALTFDNITCNKVTPTPPTYQDDQCVNGTPAGATYTIVATQGVDYFVNGVKTPAGTYPAADGSTVAITAQPRAGYTLTGTTSFTHTFPATPDCTTKTTPTPPEFSDDQCVNNVPAGATYTIASTTGVYYFVNGVKTPAGTYPATDGSTVTITTQPRPGYVLTGTQTFEHTFPAAPTCTTTVATVAPGFDNSQCADNTPTQASYTITPVTGIDYTVNGTTTPAGTYPATDGSTVTVVAVAQPGYSLTGTTTFKHTYPATPSCAASVVAAPASFTDDVCVSDQLTGASYTVPPTTGVIYSVEGSEVAAGTYPATDGTTLTVVASADTGYTLTGITQWTHTFPAKPTNCNGGGSETGNRPPSTTGTNGGTTPLSSNGGVGSTAATGVPVRDILLTGLALLLLGTACFVAATSRRRGLPTT